MVRGAALTALRCSESDRLHIFARQVNRFALAAQHRVPRGLGYAGLALFLAGSLVLGTVRGDHVTTVVDTLRDWRDSTANAAGFGIATLTLTGNKHLTQDEILTTGGITGRTSLLFLDVAAARDALKANPWVADATVVKFLPGDLRIGIVERSPYAIWQKDGRVSIVAEDGATLEPYVPRRFVNLPLIVGAGADRAAKDFLTLVAAYPAIREQVRAYVRVGDRRWNLRLRNGLDIRLPETDVAQALETLQRLDRDKKLLSRDIVAVDLRLPDRVTVRLSEAAFQARSELFKQRRDKKKGGDA